MRLTISNSPGRNQGAIVLIFVNCRRMGLFSKKSRGIGLDGIPRKRLNKTYKDIEYNHRKVQYKKKKQKEGTKKKLCELHGNTIYFGDKCFTVSEFKKLGWTKNNNNRKVCKNANELSLEESSVGDKEISNDNTNKNYYIYNLQIKIVKQVILFKRLK